MISMYMLVNFMDTHIGALSFFSLKPGMIETLLKLQWPSLSLEAINRTPINTFEMCGAEEHTVRGSYLSRESITPQLIG
jgi:hypothetical protein